MVQDNNGYIWHLDGEREGPILAGNMDEDGNLLKEIVGIIKKAVDDGMIGEHLNLMILTSPWSK